MNPGPPQGCRRAAAGCRPALAAVQQAGCRLTSPFLRPRVSIVVAAIAGFGRREGAARTAPDLIPSLDNRRAEHGDRTTGLPSAVADPRFASEADPMPHSRPYLADARPARRRSERPKAISVPRGRRRAGAAVVELAIMLPLLVLLFVIAVDFARVFHYSLTLTNCARAGALYAGDPTAAAESPFPNVQAAALAEAANLSPQPLITTSSGVDSAGRTYVEATAAYTFRTITGFPGIPNNVNLARTVRVDLAPASPDAD